jgi:hypothetical protein
LRQKPFGSPKSVVEYLGRYTHKIAISNHRIQSVNDQNVTLYKDYRVNGQKKSMSLTMRIHTAVFLAYITQTLCKNKALRILSSTLKRKS